MVVYIHPDLFNSKEAFRNLDLLIHLFEDGQHFWRIDENDLDRLEDSQWFKTQPEYVQATLAELIFSSFKAFAYRNRGACERTINSTSKMSSELNYLKKPLLVLVENAVNDGYFLKALFNNFRTKGKKLRKALEMGWLQIYNGGGKTMIANLVDLKCIEKKNPERIYIIVDSDKKSPSEIDEATTSLEEKCQEIEELPIFVLHKREIENYLPVIALEELLISYKDKSEELMKVINSYSKLDPDLKDYYDLELGFSKNKNAIYDDLETADFTALRQGLSGAGINVKKILPPLFLSEQVNRITLLERTKDQLDANELSHLLDDLTQYL